MSPIIFLKIVIALLAGSVLAAGAYVVYQQSQADPVIPDEFNAWAPKPNTGQNDNRSVRNVTNPGLNTIDDPVGGQNFATVTPSIDADSGGGISYGTIGGAFGGSGIAKPGYML